MKQHKNMLIIDDDLADRYIYRHNLVKDKMFEWSIEEATTGTEGYAKSRGEGIDCILLDYNLPDDNGLNILSTIKNVSPYTPVVLITGQGNEDIAVESMRLDAQDYLGKDRVTSPALHRAVHNAMMNMEFRREIDEQQTELENFARIMAHDMRQPARSINFLMDKLIQRSNGELNNELMRYIGMAQDTSGRMLSLINSLSAYTQLEKDFPDFTKLDFSNIVEEAKENIGIIIEERNVIINYDELPSVYGDASQLIQLMQNLLCNSIKYCEDEAPVIHINTKDNGNEILFTLSDNGIGIKEEFLKKVFDPFKRAHANLGYEGSGLGLATCRKIVERHGGKIWCESTIGVGTTFHFTLAVED